MATTAISIGPQFTMLQNVVYALPSVSVEVIELTGAVLQTSLLIGASFSNTSSTIITAVFARVVTGNATITLRKNGVG